MMWACTILILLGLALGAGGLTMPGFAGIEFVLFGCALFASGIGCGCADAICRAIRDAARDVSYAER